MSHDFSDQDFPSGQPSLDISRNSSENQDRSHCSDDPYDPENFIFVALTILKTPPTKEIVEELYAFLETAESLPDAEKRMETFKLAVQLRTYYSMIKIQAGQGASNEALAQVKKSIDMGVVLTPSQKAEIRGACRRTVWESDRTDYSNPAMIDAVIARLKKYSKTNDFEGFFNSPSQLRAATLKRIVGTTASNAKREYKQLIKDGVIGNNDGCTSLTASLMEGMRRFGRSSDTPSVKDATHLLLARFVARQCLPLLKDLKNQDNDLIAQPSPQSDANMNISKKRRIDGIAPKPSGRASQGTDFMSVLSAWWAEREAELGADISAPEWNE
ncbi:hypothetical protein H0H81_003844 [Sphagnurus paluster]|uniref:Uncharacterized protein n=1 Tax=Sphagnurus paluster TaxID=117069 RepID=A0A9P7GLB3_9AGAR|nr:hypothetical protein H0H81_003844 [Sphagnurus paluster]